MLQVVLCRTKIPGECLPVEGIWVCLDRKTPLYRSVRPCWPVWPRHPPPATEHICLDLSHRNPDLHEQLKVDETLAAGVHTDRAVNWQTLFSSGVGSVTFGDCSVYKACSAIDRMPVGWCQVHAQLRCLVNTSSLTHTSALSLHVHLFLNSHLHWSWAGCCSCSTDTYSCYITIKDIMAGA